MAGGEKFLFPHEISSYNAVDWSEDGNIAIATDGGIIILTLQWSPTSLDSKPIFFQTALKCPEEPNDMLHLSVEHYENLQNEVSVDQAQEIALDRTLCPIVKSTTSFVTYKYARWSPKTGNENGKCILATLTLDHRLCLYSTENLNNDFHLLVELSSVFAENFKLTDLTFECLKDTAHRISAVEISWSPLIDVKGSNFSILSVGMSNGDIVLWKVKFPCKGQEDCEKITVLQLASGLPSAITWCNKILTGNIACCIVGFETGLVSAISVNINIPSKTTALPLCDQKDFMKVTNVSAVANDDDKLTIIATKEVFILSFEVEVIYKILRLFSSSHTTGDYNYFASGLSYNDGKYLLSSCDGTILTFSKSSLGQFDVITCKHSSGNYDTKWSCYGVTWSKCGLFCVAAFKPSNICEDRQLKPGTLEIQIMPIDIKNHPEKLKHYLLGNQSLDEIPECLEVFRENLWEGKNPLPEINEMFSDEEKWLKFSPKILRVLRYFLLAVQVRIPRSDKEKSEELMLSESNINKITDTLLCKHISVCLNKVVQIKQRLENNDLITLLAMVNWMDCKQDLISSSSLGDVVKKIKTVLKNLKYKFTCCICDEELIMEDKLYKCKNGHSFGLCCQTLVPCLYDVRTCSICGAVATSMETVECLSWLEIRPFNCTLCDGFLM